MRFKKNVMRVKNNKKDLAYATKQLQVTTDKFIDNTQRLIYNFNK